ncbi:hypothetical protein ABPG74_019447 [Tetrahymena malaccensis]
MITLSQQIIRILRTGDCYSNKQVMNYTKIALRFSQILYNSLLQSDQNSPLKILNLCTTGAAANLCSVQSTAAAYNTSAAYYFAKNPSDCAADSLFTAVAASQASCSNTSAATCIIYIYSQS